MIVRIEPTGTSFRGAGLYYLHDKAVEKGMAKELMPKTDERVWFTDTRNCANFDPEKALDEMWHVAESQQWLKAQVGGRTSGRVCEEPVKTMSLSWAKDDKPTPEHMIAAADAFLKHMGWDEHQAVFVAHRDTDHSHLHIILNRVHPETGRTLDDWRDHPRAQAWALGYEKEMGKLWCVEREMRAAVRESREPELDKAVRQPSPERQPANQHIPDNVIEIQKRYEKLFVAHEKAKLDASLEAERATLKAEQRAEREQWFEDGKKLFRETRHAVYDAVRAEFREQWRDLYRDRAAAGREAEAHSGTTVERAFHFARDGDWDKALAAFGDRNAVRDDAAREMAERLAALKAEQTVAIRERQEEAIKELREQRDAQYQELLDRQREERTTMRAAHVQGQSAEFVLETRQTGGEHEQTADAKTIANDNRVPIADAAARSQEPGRDMPGERAGHDQVRSSEPAAAKRRTDLPIENVQPEAATAVEREAGSDGTFSIPVPEAPEPSKQMPDLAAGAIGKVADYLADQMAEMLAPTPPQVREARAKAEAAREAEREPDADQVRREHQRRMEAIVRNAQRAEEEKRSRDYWNERDRGRDR